MSNTRTKANPSQTTATTRGATGSGTHPSRRDRVLVVATVLALAVGSIAFLLLSPARDEPAPSGTELAHVHGLGIDPAGHTLIVGSHYGLFRVRESGETTRIADRVQDFMGFTVAGPHHYLASGHPGAGQPGPSSLGLIESTDGGQTWQSKSLAGEADFHALEARHGLVYGYNSLTGTFMVSNDEQHWDTRAQLPMADFAVSPDDPDVILATTEQGLARSDDGGRTFRVLSGAPLLLLVSWANDGTIIGIEPDGAIQASTNTARTWQQRGNLVGSPEALDAVSDQSVFAAAGGKVLSSTDGGRTFTVRYPRQ